MPTHRFGFRLMPHNLFATNPAMTIRDEKEGPQSVWGQCSEQTRPEVDSWTDEMIK